MMFGEPTELCPFVPGKVGGRGVTLRGIPSLGHFDKRNNRCLPE